MLVREKAESLINESCWDPTMPDAKKMSQDIPIFARYVSKKLLKEYPISSVTLNSRINLDTLMIGIIALIHECHQNKGKSICWKSSVNICKKWNIGNSTWFKFLRYLTHCDIIHHAQIKKGSCTFIDGSLIEQPRTVIAFKEKMGEEFENWRNSLVVSKVKKGVPSTLSLEIPPTRTPETKPSGVLVSKASKLEVLRNKLEVYDVYKEFEGDKNGRD